MSCAPNTVYAELRGALEDSGQCLQSKYCGCMRTRYLMALRRLPTFSECLIGTHDPFTLLNSLERFTTTARFRLYHSIPPKHPTYHPRPSRSRSLDQRREPLAMSLISDTE